MTSKPVATLLADLDVTRPHSRPRVSNDNPYSEVWLKTLKHTPVFPNASAQSAMQGSSWAGSCIGITMITATREWGGTLRPTCTTASLPARPVKARQHWPPPGPGPVANNMVPRPAAGELHGAGGAVAFGVR